MPFCYHVYGQLMLFDVIVVHLYCIFCIYWHNGFDGCGCYLIDKMHHEHVHEFKA
jgi:hypothetical protein